jgi:hypothetical protein
LFVFAYSGFSTGVGLDDGAGLDGFDDGADLDGLDGLDDGAGLDGLDGLGNGGGGVDAGTGGLGDDPCVLWTTLLLLNHCMYRSLCRCDSGTDRTVSPYNLQNSEKDSLLGSIFFV